MDLNVLDAYFILFLVYRSWTMQHSGLIQMHDHTEWYQTFACKYHVMMFLFVSAYITVNINDMSTMRWVTQHGFPDDMNTHDNWHLISMKQQQYLWSSKYTTPYSWKCVKYMTLVHVHGRWFMILDYQLLHLCADEFTWFWIISPMLSVPSVRVY